MRIVVSVDDNNGLESICSPHFGRCPYFAVIDTEGREVGAVECVANPFFPNHEPGQVPGFVHSLGADVMLTGGMGGRAIMFFRQYGIEPVTGAAGSVRHALEAYLGGALRGAASCSESVEHGHQAPSDGVERDDVGRLREEVEMLKQQLDDALVRLNDRAER
jgi:predicted Fe-Mo cluster-binding NifX family protein